MIPLGTPYPWDLDTKGDEDTGYCVIDLVCNMAMRRTRDQGKHVHKHCFLDWQACNTACERVRKDIDPDARAYPYGGEDEDDYRGGYTAEVAIRLAQQNKWAIYIMHGQNKIYARRPDSGEVKKKRIYQSSASPFTTIMLSTMTVRQQLLVVLYNRSAR